ncbi:replication endonuclease [Shewanella japonica]|uniref:replication endonuclease n=1 Tax=Shewanella japonica TaxID=93973 RepID=UPI00249574A5|nr:replication endonuclease [Shewanella japonica]
MDKFRRNSFVKAMDGGDEVLSPYLFKVESADAAFISRRLSVFPSLIKRTILEEAFAKPTPYLRNRHILDTTSQLFKLLPKKLAHMFFGFDDDINLKAKECAEYCRRIVIDPSAIQFISIHHQVPDETKSHKNSKANLGNMPEKLGSDTELLLTFNQIHPEKYGNDTELLPAIDQIHPEKCGNDTELLPAIDQIHPEKCGNDTELLPAIDLVHPEKYGNDTELLPAIDLVHPEKYGDDTELLPAFDQSHLTDCYVDTKGLIADLTSKQQQTLYEFLSRYIESFGLKRLELNQTMKISGCIKRYSDKRWWLRKFRKVITQANEKAALHLNFINSKRQVYASNITTKNRIAQRLRNDELLSSSIIINDLGQKYTLKEVSDLNVSNPQIRKDELICRARGFENIAKEEGHEALFVTITCPSKYHRAFSKSGAPNPKWQGLMPDEANAYLNKQWQKTRAEFNRHNINPYGFRVVEPQHDGTPHWHMLFFIEGEKLETMQDIIRHYALEVDGEENGAAENRCDFKKIDSEKGSATGYILKYIFKNIDGEGLGTDKFGNDSVLVAQRIDAWASCWCIRQFQQIGGASVSVWRELRRIRIKLFKTDAENNSSVLEQARLAADNSDWQGYNNVMGGVLGKSKDRPIKLHYELNIDEQTGECLPSYYDGELTTKVKGLCFAGKAIITRLYQWRVERA